MEETKLIPDPILGIRLDLGCGKNKHSGAYGVDKFQLDGVDLVHDLICTPWPLPDNCAHTVYAISLWQEIPRGRIREFMSELHRVAKPDAEVFLAGYYGHDWRFLGNPLCVNPMVETTLMHWDANLEWFASFQPECKFEYKFFARVPAGLGQDYNAVLKVKK